MPPRPHRVRTPATRLSLRRLPLATAMAMAIATPDWAHGVPVATIGDHTFYKVTRL